MSDELEDGKMSLLDHLIELRQRLMFSFAAFIVLFFICYYFSEDIFRILVAPYAHLVQGDEHRRMIFTALQEAFFTYIKLAAFGAFFLAFPVIATQLWLFVAPGLYRNERRAFLPFLIATPFLFLLGAAMVYFIVMPLAYRFFLSFESPGVNGSLPIQLEAKVDQYLALSMRLIIAFGISFELPVLITLLSRVGLASAAGLAEKRRYAVVIAFIFAAIITPPDVISQVMLAVPLIALYEISIVAARLVERGKARQEEAAAEEA